MERNDQTPVTTAYGVNIDDLPSHVITHSELSTLSLSRTHTHSLCLVR